MMETQNIQLLVVDDDLALRELLERYLKEQGYSVNSVEDGIAMDAYLEKHEVDLIILDIMLPGEDGLSIARRLQVEETTTPILMLSARGDEVDRIIGLEMGADDYLPKPFNPRELVARIKAVLRRQKKSKETNTTELPKHNIYKFDNFKLDLTTHQLNHENKEIPLTSGEFELLKILIEHPNRVLSRDTLIDLLKGFERSPYDRSIDVRVTRLRHKIESDPTSPHFIRTVWGAGYMFTPDGQTIP